MQRDPGDQNIPGKITGECGIDEHGFCHGNHDVIAGGQIAVHLRCACACHRKHRAPNRD